MPGVPLPEDVTHPATGAFQSLIGGQAVPALAAEYGFEALTPDAAVTAAIAAAGAGDQRGSAFVAELALRMATGVAAISVVLDPGLVVLGGDVGRAGGMELASRVKAEVGHMPGPPPGGADRGHRRPGAARRDPGRRQPGPPDHPRLGSRPRLTPGDGEPSQAGPMRLFKPVD